MNGQDTSLRDYSQTARNAAAQKIVVEPLDDVTVAAQGRFHAASAQPWLSVPALLSFRGNWVRIRYQTSLFDETVRPLIRFEAPDGPHEIQPMNGAWAGRATWIGRIPASATAIAISPARRPGFFSFAIESIKPVSRLTIFWAALRRKPKLALMGLGARLMAARAEAHHCLQFAALGQDLTTYRQWLAANHRAADLHDFDTPPIAFADCPSIHVVITKGTDAAMAQTRQSLAAQIYPRWTAREPGGALQGMGTDDDLVCLLKAGDTLPPLALAQMAQHFADRPQLAACYGDEDVDGTTPLLKPDWSPIFQQQADYVGRSLFLRLGAARALGLKFVDQLSQAATLLAHAPQLPVDHLRRLILRRSSEHPPKLSAPPQPTPPLPPVSVIVPLRDQPKLLQSCLDGVLLKTDYPALELVLVDNGSVDPQACALLQDAAKHPNVHVVSAPGSFNYSDLCNRGAAAAQAPVLVFLNNDVEITQRDWLTRLVPWALRPQIGTVGCKLLFPDGLVQHCGDVIGMGGTARQAYRLSGNGPGYLGQMAHAREVSAVTGAVQVVERHKFDAIGGFDAQNFPIVFSDSDLCLRLLAAGWTSLCDPTVTLTHIESASRGFEIRPIALNSRARAQFLTNWQEAIRDDGYYHPALSLYRQYPALA